jgi:hypothetical protein
MQPALPPTQPPPGHQMAAYPARPYNTWAIVSACFAASTIIGTWCFGGIIAVIAGHVARSQIRRTGEAGGNLALAGLIVGYVAIGLFLLFILAYVVFFLFVFTFAATHSTPSPVPSPTPFGG